MGMLVARPISRRSEGRTFAVFFCAFTLGIFGLIIADAKINIPAMPSFPVYPNAKLVTSTTDRSEMAPATPWLKVTYATSDKLTDVKRFYEQSLWDQGWSKSLCGYYERRSGYLLYLTLSSENGSTAISISTGIGKMSCDYAGGEAPGTLGTR